MKIEEYKGHKIFLERGVFEAMRDGGRVCREEKLSDLKKWIDGAEKKRVRGPVIFRPGYSSRTFVEGEVTSIAVEKRSYGGNRYDAWISWKDEDGSSRREKNSLTSLIKPTEDNKKLVREINDLVKTKESIEDKIDKLEEKLEHFKSKDFGYED